MCRRWSASGSPTRSRPLKAEAAPAADSEAHTRLDLLLVLPLPRSCGGAKGESPWTSWVRGGCNEGGGGEESLRLGSVLSSSDSAATILNLCCINPGPRLVIPISAKVS